MKPIKFALFGTVVRLRNVLAATVAASALLLVAGAVSPGTALAYGAADQPLAQVELSANCDNASFALCQPRPVGVGTGGIWFWVEVDANGTGNLSGADCHHTVGGASGPGGAGAVSIKQSVTWAYATIAAAASPGVQFFGTVDPTGNYYLIRTLEGAWLIPTTTGHYSVNLATGVQIQITVAP